VDFRVHKPSKGALMLVTHQERLYLFATKRDTRKLGSYYLNFIQQLAQFIKRLIPKSTASQIISHLF